VGVRTGDPGFHAQGEWPAHDLLAEGEGKREDEDVAGEIVDRIVDETEISRPGLER